MKATQNNSATTTNKTQKPSPDIRNNSLFTDMTAQEEVFVRGGWGGMVGRPKMPG
ncbi:hypothetical protein PCC9214_02906 [Planktothrix tepida]|uniref:Uncharacterized protein n=1 Tax=Planktothrix tepida PCC 9214 TaxID=671072 RepID=A0A1J1LNE6_9CYAN|nr:hypothetical protein [Planktothrix tepida]CAD5956607.1 hypothetical protein PCC9214_02906 [Planktothrix tepida]CUR34093.1 conserved hypothetical protein [Planktothrix tepida PCC 9214]